MNDVFFAQIRELGKLQKLRQLTIDDLELADEILDLQDFIPYVFGALSAVIPIYQQVGVYAFMPLAIHSAASFFEWAFQRIAGDAYDWDPSTGYYEGDSIEDVYFCLKTVKMFAWERMYTDPKVKKSREYYKKLPWYAPLVLNTFRLIKALRAITTDLAMYVTVTLYLKTASATDIVTGSGKTSLLLAMCREMEMTKGSGTVVGRIGYLEQSPWIMNNTMRANIIFGRKFDEDYFWKVVHACALTQDMESWPDKDLTLIGERGVNISGGQRARLALARTVYSRADVYILDDPLSAVDAHVKRHILDNVLLSSGLLGDKLRIIATHTESMLPFCNQIVTVCDKTVSVVVQTPKEHTYVAPAAIEATAASNSAPEEAALGDISDESAVDSNAELATFEDKANACLDDDDGDELIKRSWTLMQNAKYVFSLCGWHVIGAVTVSALFRPIARFIFEGYNIAALRENAKSSAVSHDAVLWYLRICLLKTVTSEMLFWFEFHVRGMFFGNKLEVAIEDEFLRSLLYAPLSIIEKADRYDIESARDEGTCTMTSNIPVYMCKESACAIESVLTIGRAALATPYLLIIVPFVIWAQSLACKITSPAANSLRSISREVNSKHSQTESVISGGSLMIRMFGVESYFISRYMSNMDEKERVSKATKSANSLSTVASMLIGRTGNILSIYLATIQSHLTKYKVNSSQLNMLQGDVNRMISNIGILIKVPSRLEEFSNNVSAFRQYSDLKPEAPYIVDDCRVPSKWPHSGNVELKNLSVKYGADQEYALKNLNVAIRPGEKIGIVGRTGAGKSTLAKAIFRLLNKNVEGSIEIDGHDTAKFGVGDFRPKLGIIPQESAMFTGTIKRNLDPLNEFTIEDMWAAMIKCGVADLIDPGRKRMPATLRGNPLNATNQCIENNFAEDEDDVDEEDNESEEARTYRLWWEKAGVLMRAMLLIFAREPNPLEKGMAPAAGINKLFFKNNMGFSNGQQQLFSLCRLLMRKCRVLVLDEATADVDLETDCKMQELIRSEFNECTVLTIAHRLNTIMNSDRIIVMEKGEIVEVGPPQELIAKGGVFAELVKANEF
ncbi:Multidrug resistance-associated protein 1 [Coemansia sp. BCRC 34301]|nr:Multidrug resistance-associated protein 1 [Coemansia sp. BCRC 34301]